MSAKPLFAVTLLLCMTTSADAQKRPQPAKAAPEAPARDSAPDKDPAPSAGATETAEPGETADAAVDSEPAAKDGANVDALRQEYLQLRDRLFRSRARAASVASALYSARIQIYLDYGSARFYSVERASIRLDGANVFDDTEGKVASDKAARFTGFVAPGRHVVTVSLVATGKDDSRFGATTESSFSVQAVGGKDLVISIKAVDEGDIAFAWKKKQSGTYRLHLNANVKSVRRSDSKSAPIKRASK